MKRGISLPEMLVILAIMGCFIAILAVRVMPLVDQERDGRFEADMRIIAGAMETAALDGIRPDGQRTLVEKGYLKQALKPPLKGLSYQCHVQGRDAVVQLVRESDHEVQKEISIAGVYPA